MLNHEHFKVLSAIAITGQLSTEEYRELNEHLRGCLSCRRDLGEYLYLIDTQLPRVDPYQLGMDTKIPEPDREFCDRFLTSARAAGIRLSNESVQPARRQFFDSSWGRWEWQPTLAVMILAVIGLGGAWASRNYQIVPRASSQMIDRVTSMAEPSPTNIGNPASEVSIQILQKQLDESRRRLEMLVVQLRQAKLAGAEIASENKEKENLVAELKVQNDMLSRQIANNLSDSAVKESRMQDIAASFERKMEDLERERQLTAANNDVRELMTARNLHVIDVREIQGGSKAANSFGRIFYSEGQFLIFYAFDLPDPKLSEARFTFQLWGETGFQSHKLGTFQVDAREQSRWVLKVSDPSLLAGIYSVFVTADSQTDTPEPNGKKLLYAYIPGPLSHP